jgi:hypothetical protein
MLPLPKKRPCLVEEGGGGGLCNCDAVGARDWRMEYVLCIFKVLSILFERSLKICMGWCGSWVNCLVL